jgi:hypothetical protein
MKRKEEKFLKKGLDRPGKSGAPLTPPCVRGVVKFGRRHHRRRLVQRGATIGARPGNK